MQKEFNISNIKYLKLKDVFENGQCFRWQVLDENATKYLTIHKKIVYILEEYDEKEKEIEIEKEKEIEKETKNNKLKNSKDLKDLKNSKDSKSLKVIAYSNDEKLLKNAKEELEEYLDFETDYEKIINTLKKDPKIEEAVLYGKGIRILKQDLLEMIVSYIISANNNIGNIRRSVNIISKIGGEKVEFEYEGKKYEEYTFPSLESLKKMTVEDFKEAKTGFRSERLVKTIARIDLEYLKYLETLDDTKLYEALLELDGVGPKVANCIMLFGLKRKESFPIDVWVRRVMSEIYFDRS